ncbi:acyltransferase family protein [Hymenobacter daeguensis]
MEKPYAGDKVHLLYLDSLRGVAALVVVVHHALLQVNLQGYALTTAQTWFLALFQNGHYPVNFFIVLSGYCLMLPVLKTNYELKGGALSFFKKRARRILPPYYLAMLLSLLLIALLIGQKTGTHWDVSIPVTKTDVLMHVLLIQDLLVSTGGKINHSFWSISVEWRIYFLFPVLLLLWRKIGAARTVALVVVGAFALVGALKFLHKSYPDLNNNPNGIVPHYLLLFALGMLGADISFARSGLWARLTATHWTAALVLTTGLIAALSIASETFSVIPWQLIDVCVSVWGVCLLVICHRIQHTPAGAHHGLKALMGWKPLVWVGTFGYSLYLIHAPLLQVLTQYVLMPLGLNPFAGFLVLSTVGLVAIVGAAYGFFLLCERPFMTRRQPSVALAAVVEPAI